jgi:hypothetical protein
VSPAPPAPATEKAPTPEPPPPKPKLPPVPPPTRARPSSPAAETATGSLLASAGEFCRRRWLLLGGALLIPILLFLLLGTSTVAPLLSALTFWEPSPPTRQVITIPPPSGEKPAGLPSGSVSLDLSSPPSSAGSATAPADVSVPPGGRLVDSTDLSIFIYAVNAPGTVRVNGREFRVIKSEPDMQYNINAFGEHFQYGGNNIEFDVTPQSGAGRSLSPRIHMKVTLSRGADRTVIGEWRLSDSEGWQRSVTLDIPEGK